MEHLGDPVLGGSEMIPDDTDKQWYIFGTVGVLALAAAALCALGMMAFYSIRLNLSVAATQAQGTAVAQASATAQAAATATANASAIATIEAQEQWPLLLLDLFNVNGGEWCSSEWGNRLGTTRAVIAEGKYRWDVEAKEAFISRCRTPDVRPVSDFLLTVEAQQVSGPSAADYGLVFREDASNYYYFGVNPNTQSFFVSVRYFEKWFTLIDWIGTSVIRPGEVNRLTVSAEGSHFIFFINDEQVGEADDSRLSNGKAGVAIELYNAGGQAVFEFDNFQLRAPDAPMNTPMALTPTP